MNQGRQQPEVIAVRGQSCGSRLPSYCKMLINMWSLPAANLAVAHAAKDFRVYSTIDIVFFFISFLCRVMLVGLSMEGEGEVIHPDLTKYFGV